ncbi:MAG: hypothetical protein VXZ67_06985 [Pseudomonadota bacterium]|nr:hypothetical protein [Pseudomonadota bacterium]
MADEKMNACQVLSQSERVSELRKEFVCMNDNLHEGLQDHPQVLILYVAMVIFVMVFLKLVTRKPRQAKSDNETSS